MAGRSDSLVCAGLTGPAGSYARKQSRSLLSQVFGGNQVTGDGVRAGDRTAPGGVIEGVKSGDKSVFDPPGIGPPGVPDGASPSPCFGHAHPAEPVAP